MDRSPENDEYVLLSLQIQGEHHYPCPPPYVKGKKHHLLKYVWHLFNKDVQLDLNQYMQGLLRCCTWSPVNPVIARRVTAPAKYVNILPRSFATSLTIAKVPNQYTSVRKFASRDLAPKHRATKFKQKGLRSDTGKAVKHRNVDVTRAHSQPDTEEPVVRWYQQLYPWSKHRRPADSAHPDLNEERTEVKWLKQEIDQLESELAEMRGEDKDEEKMFEPLLKGLSSEDKEAVRSLVKMEEMKEKERTKMLAQYLPTLEIKYEPPVSHRVFLQHLNSNVREATIRVEDYRLRKNLWKSYARCKAFLPPFLHNIPQETWLILYKAQTLAMIRDDPLWAPHLITLLDDMKVVGKQLQPDQRMVYIEALCYEGCQEKAIAEWQDLRRMVQDDERASAEYELLGVRLFTSHGNPAKAEEIASKYLETGDRSESRILIPILDTWIQRRDETGMKHAWALYLRLKLQLESDITMEDYDSVSVSFLRGNRTDLALAVFKDMMLTGQKTDQGSVELYRKSLGLVRKMHDSAVSVEQLNTMSLTSLTVLPRQFQNKFFYGSWMKKLIGMNEIDAATSIIELMYERGIKPDSKHLNGIVGAWLRSRGESDKDKAEQMAWAMIHERIDFVKKRNSGVSTAQPDNVDIEAKAVRIPIHLKRSVAPANIETYCLLLQYYGRRAMQDKIRLVQAALEMGEVQPNNYWLNHLLHIDLHRGRHDLSWARYTETAVTPDLETFAALWDCEKAHLDALIVYHKDNFPGPRRIMHDMMSWYETRNVKERARIRPYFSRHFYNSIIRCFSQAHDLQGILVAIYILRDNFGFYPNTKTNDTITIQVARMGIHDTSDKELKGTKKRTSLRYKHKAQKKSNELRTNMALHLIQFQRSQTLAAAGYDDFEELNEEIHREERLFVLAEFLRKVMQKSMAIGEDIKISIKEAASEMGGFGLEMRDPLPYKL